MAQQKASFESVAQAIEQLRSEGRSPTVAAIVAITGGSNSTVIKHRQRYDQERPQIIAAKSVAIDPVLLDTLTTTIARAAGEASAEASTRRAEIEADMLRLTEESEERLAAIETLEKHLADAQSALLTQGGQLDQLKAAVETAKREAALAVSEARAEALRERGVREEAQMQLAKANLRLEAVPKIEEELVRLRTVLDTERLARQQAEQAAAVALAQHAEVEKARVKAEAREAMLLAKLDKAQAAHEELVRANAALTERVTETSQRLNAARDEVAHLVETAEAAPRYAHEAPHLHG